ncbi:hypothetical protein PV325_012356 [Microctonus aethiopoides]|nr:hypothetical protein PV325_012356 [Microctonus aethiopoides]
MKLVLHGIGEILHVGNWNIQRGMLQERCRNVTSATFRMLQERCTEHCRNVAGMLQEGCRKVAGILQQYIEK